MSHFYGTQLAEPSCGFNFLSYSVCFGGLIQKKMAKARSVRGQMPSSDIAHRSGSSDTEHKQPGIGDTWRYLSEGVQMPNQHWSKDLLHFQAPRHL